jgi:hypothetical protein
MRTVPAAKSFVFRTEKPPVSAARASAPSPSRPMSAMAPSRSASAMGGPNSALYCMLSASRPRVSTK